MPKIKCTSQAINLLNMSCTLSVPGSTSQCARMARTHNETALRQLRQCQRLHARLRYPFEPGRRVSCAPDGKEELARRLARIKGVVACHHELVLANPSESLAMHLWYSLRLVHDVFPMFCGFTSHCLPGHVFLEVLALFISSLSLELDQLSSISAERYRARHVCRFERNTLPASPQHHAGLTPLQHRLRCLKLFHKGPCLSSTALHGPQYVYLSHSSAIACSHRRAGTARE
jgi:hypothetical protein